MTHIREDRALTEVWRSDVDLGVCGQVNYVEVTGMGQRAPEHYHKQVTETFILLEGSLTLITTGKGKRVQSYRTLKSVGDRIVIPVNTWHIVIASPNSTYLEIRDQPYTNSNEEDKFFRVEE